MFSMTFNFGDRDMAEMDYVNKALAGMRLSALEVEDSDGYLAVSTSYDPETHEPTMITYRYGLDHLTLNCEADDGDDLYTWQMDAKAFPKGEISGSNAFHDLWCREHPDRIMRVLSKYDFNDADVFQVLHHEKKTAE